MSASEPKEERAANVAQAADDAAMSPGQLAMLILGVVLYVLSLAIAAGVEGGDGEFAHLPFTTDPLPFTPMRGFTFEQLVGHASSLLLGAPGLLLIWRVVRSGRELSAPSTATWQRMARGSAVLSVGLTAVVMLLILRGRPIVDDELAYAFQAQLLSEGKLAFDAVPHAIDEVFTVHTPLGNTGKYLFGEPLVQVVGVLVGIPGLIHLPLSLCTLYFVYRAIRLECGTEMASLAVMLVALSPMYTLTGATGMSQSASLFCVALAFWGYAELCRDRARFGALCIGLGIGFGAAVRLQVAVPVGAVVVLASVRRLLERRQFPALGVLAGTLGLWVALLGAYNQALTGSWFTVPWYAVQRIEHYGFGQVWFDNTYRHTLWTAVENLAVVATRLNVWWLGWPFSWLLLWLWFRAGRPLPGARLWLFCGAAIVLFEAGYYSTGVSDTGAIYHYELLLPLALLGAAAIKTRLNTAPRRVITLLVIQFGLGTTAFTFLQVSRLARLVEHVHAEADLVMENLPDRSLLFWEPYCSEAVSRGWVHEKFPKRFRRDADRVVTFPRPPVRQLANYLKRYRDRKCFYFHLDPRSQQPELLPCSAATRYLSRSASQLPRGAMCLAIPATATRLGLYDPIESVKRSVIVADPPDDASGK